jgi:hypothetical protein
MATHYMARELAALGHLVKQVPPIFSKPFRPNHKNDFVFGKALLERLPKRQWNRQALKMRLVIARRYLAIVLAIERNEYVTNRRHGSAPGSLVAAFTDQFGIVGARHQRPRWHTAKCREKCSAQCDVPDGAA